MASVTTSIDASKAEFWEARAQINLRKSLVAMEVAAVTTSLSGGDKIHKPYFTEHSAVAYTAGKDVTLQGASSTDDSITISTFKDVPMYIDEAEETQSFYNTMAEITDSASYQLRDAIDTAVFAQSDNGTEFDAGDLGGTDGSAIILSSSNIISLFSNARKALQKLNVTEANDFCAVLSPAALAYVAQSATGNGFNFADAALSNGKVGNFMGFDLYMSNNLATATYGGRTSTTNSYIGKKKMIQLIMLASPRMKVVDTELKIGKAIHFWTGYGVGVWTRDKSRFLDAKIYAA
jgi:hypothetical protein